MNLTPDQLLIRKEDIASVARAMDEKNPSRASTQGTLLFEQMAQAKLSESDWEELLSDLDDVELRSHMDSLRKYISEVPASALSAVNGVGYSVALGGFPSVSLLINLSFKTRMASKSLDSSQDLEDTLWIGMAVVEAVSETMQSMKDALAPLAQRNCIGDSFKDSLERVESAVRQIRERYNTITDGVDDTS